MCFFRFKFFNHVLFVKWVHFNYFILNSSFLFLSLAGHKKLVHNLHISHFTGMQIQFAILVDLSRYPSPSPGTPIPTNQPTYPATYLTVLVLSIASGTGVYYDSSSISVSLVTRLITHTASPVRTLKCLLLEELHSNDQICTKKFMFCF